ncbi:hypothetical protein [Fibrella aquatilis]|uniref:Uncharacterized protein n=1 Tax=Fibrella aquatilis TaxID=2817059 RepID=A0A939G8F5_9BACT|nr:hypothetical protein [Fibrella aquatilis]MBO0934347.1 hypothetical protein [Fibrella aquatilis]
MQPTDKPITKVDINVLREGIKSQYACYHALNRDKYPAFVFNSNRANYGPLRVSFEEEFFEKRQIDRRNNYLHIPSVNTFAQLFSNDKYIPSRKISNTCRLYFQTAPELIINGAAPTAKRLCHKQAQLKPITVGIITFICLLIAYWLLKSIAYASDLVVLSPISGQVVPRLPLIEGRATNTNVVFVVVHRVGEGELFYVQDPAAVQTNGTWQTTAYVGVADHRSDGAAFEIRAFVRPGGSYKELYNEKQRYVYDSWPETAEAATEPIIVVRGPKQR